MRLGRVLQRLQDTTAQIRVRAAFVLLIGFTALADSVGFETILGAFAAGVLLSLIDRDKAMTHPEFRVKLEAVGFGVFIPIFFVTSGVQFDLNALFANASTVARVPLFLVAIYLARGLPALVYAPLLGRLSVGRRGRPSVDLAAIHRRGHTDRPRPGRGEPGERRSSGRRRPAVSCDLPDAGISAAAKEAARGRRAWGHAEPDDASDYCRGSGALARRARHVRPVMSSLDGYRVAVTRGQIIVAASSWSRAGCQRRHSGPGPRGPWPFTGKAGKTRVLARAFPGRDAPSAARPSVKYRPATEAEGHTTRLSGCGPRSDRKEFACLKSQSAGRTPPTSRFTMRTMARASPSC